jgi:hypothetical protein
MWCSSTYQMDDKLSTSRFATYLSQVMIFGVSKVFVCRLHGRLLKRRLTGKRDCNLCVYQHTHSHLGNGDLPSSNFSEKKNYLLY